MSNDQPSVAHHSYHRVVTVALVVLNLVAVSWAIYAASPGRLDYHFREESFATWLGSAQMFGAALLFLACYFAGNIIRLPSSEKRSNATWLVLAFAFFMLALDQQFRIREHLTFLIDGVAPSVGGASNTPLAIKLALIVLGIGVVIYFRSTVLANFRMVVAFLGGFWFLLMMLLIHLFFESMGWSPQLAKVLEGSGKLLAMAMFLSGSYIVLLDRLNAANAAVQLGIHGERRRRQVPINFPDRRASRGRLAGPNVEAQRDSGASGAEATVSGSAQAPAQSAATDAEDVAAKSKADTKKEAAGSEQAAKAAPAEAVDKQQDASDKPADKAETASDKPVDKAATAPEAAEDEDDADAKAKAKAKETR